MRGHADLLAHREHRAGRTLRLPARADVFAEIIPDEMKTGAGS
jgi:hypothetical protein